jgi:hypothetical protein
MHDLFQTTVYSLCFLTCSLCAFLLARAYLGTRARLLFWSALCFFLLAINALLVILDMVILPDVDFGLSRPAVALAAIGVLLFGFIWDVEEE